MVFLFVCALLPGCYCPAQSVAFDEALTTLRNQYTGGQYPLQKLLDQCAALENQHQKHYNKGQRAALYTLWGNVLLDKADSASLRQARDKHQAALRDRQAFFGPQSEEAARSWLNLGNAYFELGDRKACAVAYQNAWHTDSLLFPPDDTRLLPIVQNQGDLCYHTEDFSGALRWWQHGSRIAEHHGDPEKRWRFLQGMGDAALALGAASEAAGYYRQAQALANTHTRQAETFLALGTALEQAGDPTQGQVVATQALSLWPDAPAFLKKRLRTLLLLGRLARQKNQNTQAASYYQQALNTLPLLPAADPLKSTLLVQLSAAWQELDDFQKAAQMLHRAATAPHKPTTAAGIALQRIYLALQTGKTAAALDHCQTALALPRSHFPDGLRFDLYIAHTQCLYQTARKDPAASWTKVLESSQHTLEYSDSLKKRLNHPAAARQIHRKMRTVCHIAADACLRLGDTLQALLWAETAKNAAFSPIQGSKEAFWAGVQARHLSAPTTAVLEYVLLQDRLIIFALRRSGLQARSVPIDTADLYRRTERFFLYCATPPALFTDDKAAMYREMVTDGHWFFKTLLESVLQPTDAQLVIVADGLLHYLPFEAFLTAMPDIPELFDQHAWMVQQYVMHYVPFLSNGHKLPHKKACSLTPPACLIMAPAFAHSPSGLKALPGSLDEAKILHKMLKNSHLYTDTAATRTVFTEQAPQHRLLHLSTHGVADAQSPAYSYIAFTATPDSEEYLYATEIEGLSLVNTDLVVLSACQTQYGQLSEGEGLLSLSAAFRQAGVSALVASLWNVSDLRSGTLQQYFYTRLLKGVSKNEALTEAKRAYIKGADRESAHPFYWAGTQLIGDHTPVFPGPMPIGWVIAMVLLAGLCFMLLYKRFRHINGWPSGRA